LFKIVIFGSLVLRFINYNDCHAEEKSHRFEHGLPILYYYDFERPIINQVGHFMDHIVMSSEILKSMSDNPFYHFALFAFQVVWNLDSTFWQLIHKWGTVAH
jgi:hypothetical protein